MSIQTTDDATHAQTLLYATKDLVEAAVLMTRGHRIKGIDIDSRSGGRSIGYWRFVSTPELEEDKALLVECRLLVEPRTFQANVKKLKASIQASMSDPAKRSEE